MAKRPDRDPAKHSKKDPAKPTRAKAARPDASPLDPSLADILNPAIGHGRAGVGSQTGSPSPHPGRASARPSASLLGRRWGWGSRGVTRTSTSGALSNDPHPYPSPQGGGENDAFERRIVALLAFGAALTMIAFAAISGRGTVAMWGYPLWLYLGLWIVLTARSAIDRVRLTRIVAAWGAVFAVFAIVFIVNYSVLPFFDHRYRAVLFPGDKLGADLTEHFHAATGAPLRYVIGSMWDGGNLAHYSPDQPQVLIDGLPARAPWIDLNDLRAKGAMVVWTGGDGAHLPAQFATVAANAELGAPFDLPMRRGPGEIHVGWAILKPQ
jgi:hypothetical protein